MVTHVFWGKDGSWTVHGSAQENLEKTRERYERILNEQCQPDTPTDRVPDALLLVELSEHAPPRAVTYRLEYVVRLVSEEGTSRKNHGL